MISNYQSELDTANMLPPASLPDEDQWQMMDDRICDLCAELRPALPQTVRLYREDSESEQLIEVW